MKSSIFLVIFVGSFFATVIQAQRPPYAGSRPVGYKDRFRPKPTAGAVNVGAAGTGSINDIDNRFGENTNNFDSSVSQRPPIGVDVVYGEPPTDQWKQQQPQQQQPEQQTVASSSSQQPPLLQQGPIVSSSPPPPTVDIAIRQQPEVDIASSSQQSQQPTTSTNLAINQNNPTTISSTDLLTGGPIQQQQFRPSTVSGGGFVQPQQRPITSSSTPLIPANRPQTTSGHLPYDAHGDTFLVNLLNQRPVDQRPFWLVNYQAIEAHRNGK